ncbi:hypothetical protein K3G39_13640 [Pontibacter sp. HSC-14F20]|uniref:hypothetical protein n=1 Tax=Pontibacter sp. HSC-14F20 TaxID=2864136 RepID=UPI001C732F1D|nr:hypothetical protein [Pontibacter sp. HSC-14F20]MBX0334281.1 hypothetical protein [Pontibacter sp. HSC-14F20]
MAKNYKLFLMLLLCVLVSCGDDDDPSPNTNNNPPDTESPKVKILSPETNSTYLVIDMVRIDGRLSDNMALGSLKFWLVAADGQKHEVIEPFIFTDVLKFLDFGASFFPRDIESGTYKLVLEIKDRQNNVAKDSISINVHAPDINSAAFANAFKNGSFYHYIDWGWYGVDFTNGVEFNEAQFSNGVFLMMSQEYSINKDQWEKFVKDFRFEKQTWATWDEDGSGDVVSEEFEKGLDRLELFNNWDLNNDRMVKEDEFILGIFESWDRNRDNMLSKAEYHDSFHTYLRILN